MPSGIYKRIKRKTHCVNGHAYTLENSFINTQGKRICVACRRIRGKNNYKNHPGYFKNYYKSNSIEVIGYVEKWQKLNIEKRKAHHKVEIAIKKGKILKEPCTVCGSEKSEGHHEDYSKPLEVIWLCRLHHKLRFLKLTVCQFNRNRNVFDIRMGRLVAPPTGCNENNQINTKPSHNRR